MSADKGSVRRTILFMLFPVVLFVAVFWAYIGDGSVLITTDAAISDSQKTASDVFSMLSSRWTDHLLLGMARNPAIQIATLLKIFFSGVVWNNLVYGIALLFSSAVLFARFFKRLNPWAVLCAMVVAFWTGSNLTLIYAGHMHKPYVVFFFVCALCCSGISSWRGGILWGASVGLAFMQQPDVALFFALFAGAYLVFRLWNEQGYKPLTWLKVLLPAAVVAFLFAAGPLLSGYEQQVKGAAQMQTDNKQAKWDYVTQWSFPPEEMIAFVAPGYTGWRSGESDGPYWGRMGRSPGWEQTRQGFQNFKLENTYLGIIPIAFALFALFSCRRSKHRAEILFWGGATLVALLLSFGKFFPLYSLFYKLPVVNNIRNPNKFLQVFQVCLAILTAYGFDALFSQKSKVEGQKSDCSGDRKFFWVMIAVLGGLVLWSLSASMNLTSGIAEFTAQGWPQDAAKTISQNQITALWHASAMAAIVAAVFALFSFPNLEKICRYKNWIAVGLVLIVAADAVKLSKHYVKEMPRSYIEANALTEFLKENLGPQRVALASQQGMYNIWTTYLLPYNKIPTFNFSDMPRMANDYKVFLERGQQNLLNMWRFSSVKYLLGSSAVEKQLAGQARKVFAYDLAAAPDNEFRVVATPTGQHAVFELLNTFPRYAVTAPIETMPDEQALTSISQLPRPQTGIAEVLSYRPGKVKLRVAADVPSTLRVAEKWDADWKAAVDGKPVEVARVDYLCQGVDVPAGTHEVMLKYAPSKLFFYMQCGGYLILIATLSVLLLRRKEEHAAD